MLKLMIQTSIPKSTMKKLGKFIMLFVLTIIMVLSILMFFDWGRLLVGSLIGATSTGEPYIHLTRQEKEELANLSRRYDCKIKLFYESVVSKDGEALPALDSNSNNDSTCSIYFSWKEEQRDKSLCRQDTSYLRQFALNLLPELFEKTRYVKDYPIILFNFSTDDDTNPINGCICEKDIIIKR